MFRALICPSSGACDYVVALPHWLISFLDCYASAGISDTTLAEPHTNSNT